MLACAVLFAGAAACFDERYLLGGFTIAVGAVLALLTLGRGNR